MHRKCYTYKEEFIVQTIYYGFMIYFTVYTVYTVYIL